MQEESIYNIMASIQKQEMDELKERNCQNKVSSTHKINLLKNTDFKATGRAVVFQEYQHLLSKENLASSFSQPRKGHSTFGVSKCLKPPTHLLKKQNPNLATEKTCQKTSIRRQCKPPLPAVTETPVLGLRSDVDFVSQNRQFVCSLKPPSQTLPTDFLAKSDFGSVPQYLDTIKKTIQKEQEFIKTIQESKQCKPESLHEIDAVEVEEMKRGLVEKREAVVRKYQCLTHITKVNTIGLKRRKEGLEKEMDRIEKDLEILQRGKILIKKE